MTRLQSAAPVFDAHVHVWSADRERYPMVSGRDRPLEHDGSAETLLSQMDAAGVSGALLVQTPWLGEDNRYLVDAMRRHPRRFAALGWLEDPLAIHAPDRIERHYHEDGFRGVRLHLTDDRVNAGVAAGECDSLFRKVQALEVPVQFLNRVPSHPTVLSVARRFPELALVIDHLGHPEAAESPEYASSKTFFELAGHPNVYVKVSNHVLSSRAPYPWPDLHGYQRRLLDAFGPRRLMWGSNWPMRLPPDGPAYAERLDAVRVHLPGLAPEDRDWLIGRTALSLWPPA